MQSIHSEEIINWNGIICKWNVLSGMVPINEVVLANAIDLRNYYLQKSRY